MNSQAHNESEPRSLQLLQQIRDGAISPKSLKAEQRLPLVSLLINEGQSTPEIAQILDVSDRTIERDRKTLREKAALESSHALLGETAGQLASQVELSVQRILQIARDKTVPASVRVEAYRSCVEIRCRSIERLQSLGLLPTAATRFEAKLHQAGDQIPDLDTIRKEIERLQQEDGDNPDIKQLVQDVEKAKLASRIEEISKNAEAKGQSHEN